MNIRAILTAVISLSLAGHAYAQDRIFQSNGHVIEAKIKNINSQEIIYKHWNDRYGAEFALPIKEVDKVVYENGYEERFNAENSGQNETQQYVPSHTRRVLNNEMKATIAGNKLLSIAPIAFTENGVGLAVSYEKMIDKSGIIAFVLPVMATFNLNSGTESDSNKHQDAMFYFSPGLKFYPTGCYGRTKYAVGPSLVVGVGEKTTGGNGGVYSYNGYYPYFEPYKTQAKFILGILVNNSVNINPSPHLSLGLDFGFGFTYINTLGGENQGMTGMVQGAFKIGYRY